MSVHRLFASIVGKRRSMWIRSLRATVSTSRGEGLLLLLREARFCRYVGNRPRGSLLDGGGAGGGRCIELARYSEVSGPSQARGFSQPCPSARRCVVYRFGRPGMAWNQLRP